MADDKKPFLSIVRESHAAPAEALPPVPAAAPESAHRSALRARLAAFDTTLPSASRLAAIGVVLSDGASELRPSMSAKSAAAWVKSHVDKIDRARLNEAGSETYAAMPDLRDAVLGAAAELDEAGEKSPKIVSALYAVVDKVEVTGIVPAKTVVGAIAGPSWWSGVMELHALGSQLLSAER